MPELDFWIAFVYVLTIGWVLYTARGTRSAWINLGTAKQDRTNLQKASPTVNGITMIAANGAVSDQLAILVALAADCVTGLISLTTLILLPPQTPAPSTPIRVVANILISILLTAGAVALVRMSEAQRTRRLAQRAIYRRGRIPPSDPPEKL